MLIRLYFQVKSVCRVSFPIMLTTVVVRVWEVCQMQSGFVFCPTEEVSDRFIIWSTLLSITNVYEKLSLLYIKLLRQWAFSKFAFTVQHCEIVLKACLDSVMKCSDTWLESTSTKWLSRTWAKINVLPHKILPDQCVWIFSEKFAKPFVSSFAEILHYQKQVLHISSIISCIWALF